jgi:replication factor C subunit 3/5
MTAAAQAALRRVVEQYTRNCRFCFICNYLSARSFRRSSRAARASASARCRKRRRAKAPGRDHGRRSGSPSTPDGLAALVKLGRGDMRRSLNILQSVSMSFDH